MTYLAHPTRNHPQPLLSKAGVVPANSVGAYFPL